MYSPPESSLQLLSKYFALSQNILFDDRLNTVANAHKLIPEHRLSSGFRQPEYVNELGIYNFYFAHGVWHRSQKERDFLNHIISTAMKMRMQILFLVTLSSIQLLNAQTEKGNSNISGNAQYWNSSNEQPMNSSESSYFAFNPGYSYFLKDNFALGVDFNIGNSLRSYASNYVDNLETYEETNAHNAFDYGFGLIAQNYVKLAGSFSAIISSRISYGRTISHYEFDTDDPRRSENTSYPWSQETKSEHVSFTINPGLIYFVTPRFGVQGTLDGLNFTRSETINESLASDNESSMTSFSLNLNPSNFRLGASFFF